MNGPPQPPKILISDDQPEMAAAWNRRGRQLGLEVIMDMNSQVVELAREHQPVLILLDVNQTVNGLELLHVLKRDPQTRHIPVMVISAADEDFIRETCREFGAVEFVAKPVDDAVVQRVAEYAHAHAPDQTPPTS